MTEKNTGRINTEMEKWNGDKDNGKGHGQTMARLNHTFEKKLTVNIELLGEERVPTYEVIQSARLLCGGLLACRSIGTRKYELTMSNEKGKQRLLEGFKIGNTSVVTSELCNDEMVVSFLNLSAYITDEEILEKLSGWGVKGECGRGPRLRTEQDLRESNSMKRYSPCHTPQSSIPLWALNTFVSFMTSKLNV